MQALGSGKEGRELEWRMRLQNYVRAKPAKARHFLRALPFVLGHRILKAFNFFMK